MSARDIGTGGMDSRGLRIDYVYHKTPSYAVYRAGDRILVEFSDEPSERSTQIAHLAKVLPFGDKLTYLTKCLAGFRILKDYDLQFAEALRLGLEGQPEAAQETVDNAMADAKQLVVRAGRRVYFLTAASTLGAWIVVFIILQVAAFGVDVTKFESAQPLKPLQLMLVALFGGSIGVVLSIAISIQSRTLTIDEDKWSNKVDAILRVSISVLSAGVLYAGFQSGVLPQISIGGATVSGTNASAAAVLLLGVVAGFVERLVPSILSSTVAGKNA